MIKLDGGSCARGIRPRRKRPHNAGELGLPLRAFERLRRRLPAHFQEAMALAAAIDCAWFRCHAGAYIRPAIAGEFGGLDRRPAVAVRVSRFPGGRLRVALYGEGK